MFPEENALGQKFVISADLYTDTRKAGKTDDLADSVHYGEVSAFISLYLKKHTFKLLESAAENLAEELLIKYPLLQEIRLVNQKTMGSDPAVIKDSKRRDQTRQAYGLYCPGF